MCVTFPQNSELKENKCYMCEEDVGKKNLRIQKKTNYYGHSIIFYKHDYDTHTQRKARTYGIQYLGLSL